MNTHDRRLDRLEAKRPRDAGSDVRVEVFRSPDGMTGLAEQEAWFATQPKTKGALHCQVIRVQAGL